jgi:chloramphenicol-sensitive protein RarD
MFFGATILTEGRREIWLGVGAYAIWGLFPIYWKLIEFVPAVQLIAHRIAWSFLVLVPIVMARRTAGRADAHRQPSWPDRRTIGLYGLAGVLIAGNWFLYVWAVNHDFIVETSLGYFITPLVNVLIGIVVLHERLRRVQWIAVLLAASGVTYLTVVYGGLPWISIGLAVSFGTYGFVKKKARLPALFGLTIETGLLFLPAVAYLLIVERNGSGAFGHAGVLPTLLMAGSGIITTVPLVMFATAVQRVPLSVIGIVQYISPTLQFLIGVFMYDEPFSHEQLVGFSLVWTALVMFTVESVTNARSTQPEVA